MYCRNCGKEISEKAEVCTGCNISTKIGNRYCRSCGEEATPIKAKEGQYCPTCESRECTDYDHPKRDIMSTKEFCSKCGAVWLSDNKSGAETEKDWLTTLLLALFLGQLGVHRFYTGHIGTAIVLMLLTFAGGLLYVFAKILGLPILIILAIWLLVDIISIATGSFKDSNGNPLVKR